MADIVEHDLSAMYVCPCKIMMHFYAVWVAISLPISLALVFGWMPVAFWVLRSFSLKSTTFEQLWWSIIDSGND